jgi:hypothetical protein
MKKTMVQLQEKTIEFFKRHWKGKPPLWTQWEVWQLGTKLSSDDSGTWHHRGGCYVVFVKGEVRYVGLALTPGLNELNGKKGILDRLRRHVITRSGHDLKDKTRVRWGIVEPVEDIHIHVIAFPDDYRYLAAALEAFLILELGPKGNKTLPKAQ